MTATQSLRRVLANRRLRRVQLAFLGSGMGDWAYATAITVWAYSVGGATAVGVFSAVRFVTIAVAAPLGAVVADRVARKTFMMASDATRAVLVAAAAVSMGLGGPPLVVYALAVVAGMVGAPFRSAQAGLIPRLLEHPDELTSSNAVAANIENVVGFAGPALGALLVGLVDVEAALWFNVATFGWSLLLVAAIDVPPGEEEPEEHETPEGFLREVTAGFTTIRRDRDLLLVTGLASAQGVVWGALTVLMVIVSVDMLDTGAAGVGYLNALLGVGTVLGGLVILTRTTKGRLAGDMVVGVLGWSLPLLLMAVAPSPVTALVALALIGLMDPWVNVGLDTIPQRIVDDRVLSRVFAAVDSALIAAVAIGAFLAPPLIGWLGLRASLAVLGVAVTAYALSMLPRARRLDGRLAVPAHLDLLAATSILAPLPRPVVESLAHRAEPVAVAAGEAVVREGEPSDRFYVIVAGEVEVTQEGHVLRAEGPGDFFGEIGLVRDVPRTATVTARTDTSLLAVDRADFLEAVTGVHEARAAAEDVVSRRLGI
ncbi:MFS family permease [Nocardioides ginsengisegetis]|uniref:MFS family permease n=1 Tax=Nocardioides ginsengisegetis TaxID=661491 RepID=A0A7W3IY83_9ACTN|nr:MFS transporter [Nocardioides ginsengisegetis]MBA8802729.1 MFS family permease [Nocardioides ginsengisegetis]